MTKLWFGPSGVPSKDGPEEAIAALEAGGYTACEIDFERGFWMDKDWAGRFGELARDARILLSVHAPLAAFMGHVDKSKKFKMALGMLDHTSGLALAAGADPVVIHPGFLLGRERAKALDDVIDQLGDLRERLESKGRAVPFGIEVMGRVRELGTAEDCFNIAARVPWVRPVLDFAHLHAVTDGAFTTVDSFAQILRLADEIMQPGDRIHIHFSDIAYANRNETKHLPYGDGTLRAEPLGEALATIDRPAVVISESPDDASHQAIRAALFSKVAAPTS
jgi:deoxyribonuclease-4